MKAFYEKRKFDGDIPILFALVEDLNFVAHWHKEIEMIYVLEGEIGVGINKDCRMLEKGDLAVCAGNDIHYYNSSGLNSKTAMMIFKPEVISFKDSESADLVLHSFFFKHDLKQRGTIDIGDFINEIECESREKKNFHEQFIDFKLNEMFLALFRNCPEYYSLCTNNTAGTQSPSMKPMQKALKFLEENLMEEITLENVSEAAGLSPFYFSRLFKTTTGTNYSSYLSRLRIERAENLIKTTDEHIIDIAYKTGFKSIRTFNRAFKNIKGHTPQSARKR